MGSFKNVPPIGNMYSDRIINDWEHVTAGSDIVTLNQTTGAITGYLSFLPKAGDIVRSKSGQYIKQYIIYSVTLNGGTSFSASSRYKEQFDTKLYGTPTEYEMNVHLPAYIREKMRKRDQIDLQNETYSYR